MSLHFVQEQTKPYLVSLKVADEFPPEQGDKDNARNEDIIELSHV